MAADGAGEGGIGAGEGAVQELEKSFSVSRKAVKTTGRLIISCFGPWAPGVGLLFDRTRAPPQPSLSDVS